MKLLVTDLDGTLLIAGERVHDDDVRAARALRAHGVRLSIATGRLYSGSRRFARALELAGPVGCADGAQLVDARCDRALQTHALPGAAVDWLLEVKAVPFVFAFDRIHHDSRGAKHLPYALTWSREVSAWPDVTEVGALRGPDRVKVVLLIGDAGALGEAEGRASGEGLATLRFGFSGEHCLLVRRGGVDKGTAVEFIARAHGVALGDVAVVGDWLNDVPMLARGGHRFVMAHAPPEVKAHADHVVDGPPLAAIARHFGVPL